MRARVSLILGCVLCVALTAGAQVIEEFQFFPVVARTAGAGDPPTQWVTDLTVHNVEDSEVQVGIQFFPAGRATPLQEPEHNSFILAPRETKTFEDVLSDMFGYTTDVMGSLMLQGEDGEILATTRTYNVGSPEGTYGQTIPWNWLGANSHETPSIVVGARNDSRFRSNLGIVNFSEEAVTMRYRILNSANEVVAEGSRDLDMFSMNQGSFSGGRGLGVGKVDGPLTAEVSFDEGSVSPVPCLEPPESNYFIAYVSKVDGNPEGTGDAEFIYGAPVDTCD